MGPAAGGSGSSRIGMSVATEKNPPARLCYVKPIVSTAAGVKEAPLAAGGRFHEEPWDTTDDRFVEPAMRTRSNRTAGFGNPRVLVRGHPARRPRLNTHSFRHLSTARPLAGQGGVTPCIPHQGAPWTRFLGSAASRATRWTLGILPLTLDTIATRHSSDLSHTEHALHVAHLSHAP